MNQKERLQARLNLLESDLKDSEDPEVLARWPNLGDGRFKEELRLQLAEVKLQISQLDGDQAEQQD